MAKGQRFLDVWIVELNSVYRDVPFTVITDWLQQGRLFEEDRVRPAGTEKWYRIAKVPALAAFVPYEEPNRAEDQAEALEPVETGWHWRRRGDEDDDDVDMIPLIDISLVLLIFFMMTAAVSTGVISFVKTPEASHQLTDVGQGMLWLAIDVKNSQGEVVKDDRGQPLPWYSLGVDNETLLRPTRERGDLQTPLRGWLADRQGAVKISIRADRSLPIEAVREATLELQGAAAAAHALGQSTLKLQIVGEVSEPQGR